MSDLDKLPLARDDDGSSEEVRDNGGMGSHIELRLNADGVLITRVGLSPYAASWYDWSEAEAWAERRRKYLAASAQGEPVISPSGVVGYTPPVPPYMSTDSAVRKQMPIATGVLAYFPDALLCVAWISRVGNDKHNPGEPLRWAKEKSQDEKDAEVRHMLDSFRGLPPDPGLEPLGDVGHLASKAWRALADLQRACDAERVKYEPTKD